MEEEIVLMEENDIEEINIEEENYSGKPYELPIASKDILGGIKVGENLTIDADGTLNAKAGGSGTSGDLSNLKYNYVVDGERLYVDGVNGNDETGDGTESKPFKTLERFFDVANYIDGGRNDIRCYIVSAGVYTISKHSIGNLILHITGQVDGVVLYFPTERDVKFYQSHCNFQNITIDAPFATEIAFDGSNVACSNCKFNQMVKVYSSGGYFSNCTLNNLKAYYSNLELKAITITNTSPSVDAFYFNNSVIRMNGTYNVASLTTNGTGTNCFLYCNNTFLYWSSSLPTNSYKYNYGFYGAGNVVMARDTYYKTLISGSVSGIKMSSTPSLFFTAFNNVVISE